MNGAFLTTCLAALVALAVLAKKLGLPYPIVFVLGGIVLAVVPGVPTVTLAPDIVFLLFLPALIFGDGWTTDYRAFKRYAQPIFSLAIGLVVVTSVVVALVAHRLAGLPLALGFVLGAILSPTDAVATEAIAEDVGLPRRLATIINGESLVNDATGLVLYRFAVVAVLTGAFSLGAALLRFVYVAAAGVALGLAVAWAIAEVMLALRRKGLADNVIAVSISLVTPFALYVPADALGASGVLAAMTGGIYLSRRSSEIFDGPARIAAASVWNLLFFVFNGAAFVLIGLQLRQITTGLRTAGYAPATLLAWGLLIAATVIVVRYVWVFAVSRLRRLLDPAGVLRREGPHPDWRTTFVLGTAGMRGVVSLAAALALPETTLGGAPFPARDLLLFLTFVTILVTLVGEGLLMPFLVRRWKIVERDDDAAVERGRLRAAEAVRADLRAREATISSPLEWEILGRIAEVYDRRIAHAATHADGRPPDDDAVRHRLAAEYHRAAFGIERATIVALRRSGEIGDEVYRRLEYEIDLAESGLA